VIVHFGDQEMP